MTNNGEKETSKSSDEDDLPQHFSEWVKSRRRELDLTQDQLAQRVNCSVFAIRKIETGERRPSKQLAELLAQSLEIPIENQAIFIKVARGELNLERLGALSRAFIYDPLPADNLPRSLTPFIGREQELLALGKMLHDPQCSLLTIVGPGGIGKTRLAIEAANQYKNQFSDGIWFVPLAGLNSPALIVPEIAVAINLSLHDQAEPQAQLLQYLQSKNALLVLDNVEHLLAGMGVITEILKHCREIKILVTSRERLNLLSEWVFDVQGLPIPASIQDEQFASYSAVALFLQSARRVSAGFDLCENDRRCVLKICQILDGMPLGIELAASWVEMLSCEEIAQEIELNINFLTVSIHDLPERHRSIRAVFDYSWKMLSEEEQKVLGQLSVFRGGFSRQAADQVAGASLTVLSSLVNRTLVRRAAPNRFEFHTLMRQYSAAHLESDPQALTAVKKRHYEYFLALAETADQELKGRSQLEWLKRLEQELDNLRTALEWALDSERSALDGGEKALRLSGALRKFWRMRGHFHEGFSWITKSLQQSPERCTAARAAALLGKNQLFFALGDVGAARLPAEEGIAIYRELDDQSGLAEGLSLLGLTLCWQGEAHSGRTQLEDALAIWRKIGDRWGEARTLSTLGTLLADFYGLPAGREMLEQSADILEDLGEKFVLTSVHISLGILDIGFGNYASARIQFEHGLVLAREIEHPWGMADALTNLGCLYRIQGEYLTAQTFLEQSLQIYQKYGSSIWMIDVKCALAENSIVQGDLDTARIHLQEASNIFGPSEKNWLKTLTFYFQGLLAYYDRNLESASELLEQTIALAREGQFKPDLARSLIALGRVKRTMGQVLPAIDLLMEGLDLFTMLGHKLGIASAIEELGAVCAVNGDCQQAAKLFSTAQALRETLGAPLPPVDRASHDSILADCRIQFDETILARTWDTGEVIRFVQEIQSEFNPSNLI